MGVGYAEGMRSWSKLQIRCRLFGSTLITLAKHVLKMAEEILPERSKSAARAKEPSGDDDELRRTALPITRLLSCSLG